MSRGKKTPPETIYKVMASWAVTQNNKDTARALGLPPSTVDCIVRANKDKPEFVQLQNEKKADFAEQAAEIVDMGARLLKKRLQRALDSEAEIDSMIAGVRKSDMTQTAKNEALTKLRQLKLESTKDLAVITGTMFDKHALATGQPTERTEVIGDEKLQKLAELAGYEHK